MVLSLCEVFNPYYYLSEGDNFLFSLFSSVPLLPETYFLVFLSDCKLFPAYYLFPLMSPSLSSFQLTGLLNLPTRNGDKFFRYPDIQCFLGFFKEELMELSISGSYHAFRKLAF